MKSQGSSRQQQPEPSAALMSLCNPEDLSREVQEVRLAIARRAYELFEARGCEHGHDWEDWFRAESELLRSVSFATAESEYDITIRARVLGFGENELKVCVEPRRITILGKKGLNATETEGGKVEYIDWCPDQILQCIDLASAVVPEKSVVELRSGLLKFELPKVTAHTAEIASAAA